MLFRSGQFQRLLQARRRALTELNERGLTEEAAAIDAWLKSVSPESSELDTQIPQGKKPVLPTHCPQCGAVLRPDEVEWLDEITAECGYCGSPVREADS